IGSEARVVDLDDRREYARPGNLPAFDRVPKIEIFGAANTLDRGEAGQERGRTELVRRALRARSSIAVDAENPATFDGDQHVVHDTAPAVDGRRGVNGRRRRVGSLEGRALRVNRRRGGREGAEHERGESAERSAQR